MQGIRMGEVAVHAGVSRATVSNVLNHPERVSAPLVERVRAAMDDLGFVRNEAARHLRAGSSTVLALSLIDTWNPYFNEVTRGIEEVVYKGGWSLSVSTSALSRGRERLNLEGFQERRVRGILAVPTSDETIRQLVRMREAGLSCVLVDRGAGDYPVPSVSVDDVEGGRLVGEHLRSLGKRRIMFAGNPDVHVHAADRLAGLRAGLAPDADIEMFHTNSVTIKDGTMVGAEIAGRRPRQRPEVLCGANDLVAIGAQQVLLRARIHVPEEIMIVGYDDIDFASQVAVPLTTVRQPAYELGRQAAELLISDIEGALSTGIRKIVHTPELIIRSSTDGHPAEIKAG